MHLSMNRSIVYGPVQFPDNIALLGLTLCHVSHPLPCSAPLPKRDDFRNFLMSQECIDMAQMMAYMA